MDATAAETLLAHHRFVSAGDIDNKIPNAPGLYAIRVVNIDALPEPYRALAAERGHDLLYVGVATKSLRLRLLGQELRARGHGTFFRSLGALLGYRPTQGSLVGRANQSNYAFTLTDERAIIAWINTYLLISWVALDGDIAAAEKALIQERMPLVNIKHNPTRLPQLTAARAECVRIARTPSPTSDGP